MTLGLNNTKLLLALILVLVGTESNTFLSLSETNYLLIITTILVFILVFTVDYTVLLLSAIILVILFYFIATKVLIFYILFETTLIPILIVIVGYGYQPERLQASIFILFYTFIFSVWLLMLLIHVLTFYSFSSSGAVSRVVILLLPIFVKIPVYLVHA